MSPWIVYGVATSQIIIFYWLTIARSLRLVDATFFYKNPAWLAEHPATRAALAEPRWARPVFYLAGAAWLGVLAHRGLLAEPGWQVGISVMPTFAYLALLGAYAAIQYHRINTSVPLAARRSAPFRRRALRDFVHPFWSTLVFGLYAFELAVYVRAWYLGRIEQHVLVGALIGIGVITGVGAACLMYALRRKDQQVDEVWPAYRHVEVVGNVLLLYACQLIVIATMMPIFFKVQAFPMAAFVVCVNLALQAITLVFFSTRQARQLLAAS